MRREASDGRTSASGEENAPLLSRYHNPRSVFGAKESADQVDAYDSLQILHRGIQNGPPGLVQDAGVVVHYVEFSMLGHGGVD